MKIIIQWDVLKEKSSELRIWNLPTISGTNFDRPSFEKLLDKVKKGAINCIIVKDFSRFGRRYIELGDYLERIFPFFGVRFISINDHYDSTDYKGTTGGHVPYGLMKDPKDKHKLIPDSEATAVFREIFDMAKVKCGTCGRAMSYRKYGLR